MSILLRPLREDELGSWAEHHRAWYTADLAANGGLGLGRTAMGREL